MSGDAPNVKEFSSTKLDSSVNVPEASAGVKGSSFHLSRVSSLSHGLSFLCVEGMVKIDWRNGLANEGSEVER